jgi:hypothetical protein
MEGKIENRGDEKMEGGLRWPQSLASWMAFLWYSRVDVNPEDRLLRPVTNWFKSVTDQYALLNDVINES